ncbi:MAG: hypothetical protein DMG24_03430 [Acidobacteria bacterium]|nr:MAG: hypothetical protein DMG24_03430 [Acidobacteriota bacterium]
MQSRQSLAKPLILDQELDRALLHPLNASHAVRDAQSVVEGGEQLDQNRGVLSAEQPGLQTFDPFVGLGANLDQEPRLELVFVLGKEVRQLRQRWEAFQGGSTMDVPNGFDDLRQAVAIRIGGGARRLGEQIGLPQLRRKASVAKGQSETDLGQREVGGPPRRFVLDRGQLAGASQ